MKKSVLLQFQALVNQFEEQIAVTDVNANILLVNQSWKNSGIEHGLSPDYDCIGINYLDLAAVSVPYLKTSHLELLPQLRELLEGHRLQVSFDYACHSNQMRRWFNLVVKPIIFGSSRFFMFKHTDITRYVLAIEEAELLSAVDPLTGLANRRSMNRFLQNEWLRAKQEGTPISVLLIDLDGFKSINDTLGYIEGDSYMIQFSAILNRFSNNPSELAIRYGGSQFALILGNVDLHEATKIARQIRLAFLEISQSASQNVSLNVSIGIASWQSVLHSEAEQLIELANMALFNAKRLTMNGVETFKRADKQSS